MDQHEIEELKESIEEIRLYRKVIAWLAVAIFIGFGVYQIVDHYGLGAHVMDWIHLLFRFGHMWYSVFPGLVRRSILFSWE